MRENERKEFVWSLKWLHFGSQFGTVFQEANKETSSDNGAIKMMTYLKLGHLKIRNTR